MTMQSINVETLTPKQVIEFLDKYIIGKNKQKNLFVLNLNFYGLKIASFKFCFSNLLSSPTIP